MHVLNILCVILLFSAQAEAVTEAELLGSGDGATDHNAVNVTLIDDNGDILTTISAKENETAASTDNSTSIFEATTVELVTDTTTVTEISSTTVPTTESTTTTIETTSLPAETTTESTTTSTTTTTQSTTRKTTRSTTTKKPAQITTAAHVVPTVSTINPEDAGEQCLLLDPDLKCNVEIVCYGEGEIDCTEDDEFEAEESFIDAISSPAVSDDYSDYDVSESVGTFPPQLIGGKSQTKERPHLFKIGALENVFEEQTSETTDGEETNVTTIASNQTDSTLAPVVNSTVNMTGEMIFQEDEVKSNTTTAAADEMLETEIKDLNISSTWSTPVNTSEEEETVSSFNETGVEETGTENDTTVEPTVTTTLLPVTTKLSTTEKQEKKTTVKRSVARRPEGRSRRIREAPLNSTDMLSPTPLKVAALESSKRKMNIKSCRLSGNVACKPSPTRIMCTGKSFCQVVKGSVQTSEQSSAPKGVENWAIAVIAISATAGFLTIALVIYLIVTSWKKLKVQPQNGVTTLNYINNGQP